MEMDFKVENNNKISIFSKIPKTFEPQKFRDSFFGKQKSQTLGRQEYFVSLRKKKRTALIRELRMKKLNQVKSIILKKQSPLQYLKWLENDI